MQPEDEFARLRAQMDQGMAALREFAQQLWVLYDELTAQGFSEAHAIQIVTEFTGQSIANLVEGDSDER